MRRDFLLFLAAVLAVGCSASMDQPSGPASGSEAKTAATFDSDQPITVEDSTLYADKDLFRDAAQLRRAKTVMHPDDVTKNLEQEKMFWLDKGEVVKVVESAEGGFKVAVVQGRHDGRLGWMFADDLKPAETKAK